MSTSNLSVDTVAVSIQVVRVGGKQMTASVFAQIEQPETVAPELRTSQRCDTEVSRIIGYVKYAGHDWLLYVNRAGYLRRGRFDHWGYDNYASLARSMKDRHHLFISI